MKTRALDKCLRYIQRNINSGKWSPNEAIPPLKTIATFSEVSPQTVRKAVSILEQDRIIDKQDSSKFILCSPQIISLRKKSLTRYYFNKVQTSVQIAKLLHEGAIQLGQFVIKYNPITKLVFFINNNEGILNIKPVKDLLEIAKEPLALSTVLETDNITFNMLYKKWKYQQSLLSIATTIAKHQKQLGITNG